MGRTFILCRNHPAPTRFKLSQMTVFDHFIHNQRAQRE
ncbi:Uncharacterized protein ChrSV_1900 [Chromobacterium vaccinii]|nr:Uncharacterized protein ChrSW_1900 [Chromobacterium vaccinii]QND89358.1 Uncharacterized protein ChrSV_1900 [Chromobacterium vaccinii]